MATAPTSGLTALQQQQANLRGKVFQHFDGAGVVSTDLYDFKGNSLRGSRQFASDYKNAPDWSQNPALETETFASATAYDALNRAIAVTAPDGSIYRPTFNEANLLEEVDVNLRGALASGQPVWTPFVANIDYNAKGQRTLIQYGNGATTAYAYDAKTFRLTDLKTTRAAGPERARDADFQRSSRSCRICTIPTIPSATSRASRMRRSRPSSTPISRSIRPATTPTIRSIG